MSIVEKLAAVGHLTEEQVERIGRNVAEIVKEAQADPALLKEALEKMGNPGFLRTMWSHTKQMAPYAAASALLGAGMGFGAHAARSAFGGVADQVQKAKSYKKMVADNPKLQEADPNVVQKAFNTLHKFNPQYASDPLVAGTFVQNVVDQERLDIGTVKSLVDARRAMAPTGRGMDFFQMPPHDIAQKLTPEDPASQERREQLNALRQQKAEYERDKAEYEAGTAHRRYEQAGGIEGK